MEAQPAETTLASLPVGSRLLVRSRTDWRFAAISRKVDERIVLTVCSPSGHTYRLRRTTDTILVRDGLLYILPYASNDGWRQNFGRYDLRW